MVCVYCGSATRVTNSRPKKLFGETWRRRQCLSCDSVFTTSERPLLDQVIRVRSNGSLSPFSRDKLMLSLHKSVKHRQNAVTEASALTDTIASQLIPKIAQATLEVKDISEAVTQALKRFDKAAYVHYKAFHTNV